MKNSPLVIEDLEEKKIDVVVENKNTEEKIIKEIKELPPSNYIPIHLASEGLLDAPKILHFRDYTLEDAMELNPLDDDDKLNAIIRVLNNMVWEDFDCSKLHMKELSQIVYTLHLNFINQKIEKDYYLDDNLSEGSDEGQLDNENNIDSIELPTDAIQVRNINKNEDGSKRTDKFKEPLIIVDEKTKDTIGVRLTRIYDVIFAQKYCNDLFSEELKDFKPYKMSLLKATKNAKSNKEKMDIIEKIIDNDYESYLEYKNFNDKYTMMYAKVVQASVLLSLNKKKFETIEEKLDTYKNRISMTMWQYYDIKIKDYDFGIRENVTFFSEKLKKNITRRFLFQFNDFVPDINKDYSRRYHLQIN
jgi:hypothetical protein